MSTPSRDALLARYRTLGADAADRTRAITPPPPITSTHREVVALLDELIGMIVTTEGPYGTLVRNFRRLEPMLLRDFAKADPAEVAAFAHFIGSRLSAVGGQDAGAPVAGADQSQSA